MVEVKVKQDVEMIKPSSSTKMRTARIEPLDQRVLSTILNKTRDKIQFMISVTLLMLASFLAILAILDENDRRTHDHSTLWASLCIISGVSAIGAFVELVYRESRLEQEDIAKPLTSPEGPPPAAEKLRVYQLDYVKLIVNMCVLLHHHWDVSRRNDHSADWWVDARMYYGFMVEPWIMQAVAFSSGFGHSQLFNPAKGQGWLRLAAGYLQLQIGYAFLVHFTNHSVPDFETWHGIIGTVAVYPYYHMWYISSLVSWKILGHYWMRFKYPLTFAMIMALANGFNTSRELGSGDRMGVAQYARTLSYFPYFIAGLVLKNNKAWTKLLHQIICDPMIKCWAWMTIAMSVSFLIYIASFGWTDTWEIDHDNLFEMRLPYDELNAGEDQSRVQLDILYVLQRAFQYPIAFILIFSVNSVMPAYDSILRRAGTRTLGPYVLSQLVKILVEDLWGKSLVRDWALKHLIIDLLFYWGLVFLLYLPQVHEYTQYALMPPLASMGLFRRK